MQTVVSIPSRQENLGNFVWALDSTFESTAKESSTYIKHSSTGPSFSCYLSEGLDFWCPKRAFSALSNEVWYIKIRVAQLKLC